MTVGLERTRYPLLDSLGRVRFSAQGLAEISQGALTSAYIGTMRFAILGPIELSVDGRSVPLSGSKQRALLAFLLLHANEVVSRDRLIDALWGESPPPSASESLDAYVYRLRKLTGRDRLARRGGGYVLSVEDGELDASQFELKTWEPLLTSLPVRS